MESSDYRKGFTENIPKKYNTTGRQKRRKRRTKRKKIKRGTTRMRMEKIKKSQEESERKGAGGE